MLHEAVHFMKALLTDQKPAHTSVYPWRTSALYILEHGLRVRKYALEIVAREGILLAPDACLVLEVACICHDVGRIITREDHAKHSVSLLDPWLVKMKVPDHMRREIITVVADHSQKCERNAHVLSNILKDADELDEIGVMSLYVASSHVDMRDPHFFKDLCLRLEEREASFIEHINQTVFFDATKNILKEKQDLVHVMIKALKKEVDTSLEGDKRRFSGMD